MKRAGPAALLFVVLSSSAASRVAPPQTFVKNAATCASLAGLAIPATSLGLPTSGATIASADLVPALPLAVTGNGAVLATPEYCKVLGSIAPVDPAAPPINFQVNLPSSWNQKLAQMGGSGNNGVIPVALTTSMQWGPESLPPNAPYAIARGFVVYGSDSGHQTASAGRGAARGAARGATAGPPPPDWTTNDEALANFAYAQMKKTHDVVVALVAKYYGQPIRHSYYLGSSQGGREAFMVVQRFPQDYDGVFAQVPAATYVQLSIGDPLARAKSQAGDGWIPPAKVAVIAKEVLRQCDGLDGIEDGLVSNYTACYRKFDAKVTPNPFAAVRCAGGGDTGDACLSDAQTKAAEDVYATTSTFPLDHGWTSFPGWTTGGESAMNWRTLMTRPTSASFNAALLRTRVVRDPSVDLLDVNLADYAKPMQDLSAEIDAANPDLSAFRRRGGKLIMKVNTADYTVNPRWNMAYYDRIVQTMGQSTVNGFMRFYVAIGLFHNRNVGRNPLTNAPVPNYFDPIAMLDRWVEQGKAPADTQVLSDMDAAPPFTVRATLPMCRYPQYPRYKGAGDPKVAASYTCTRP